MATGKSVLLDNLCGKIGNMVLYQVGGELRMRSKGARYRDAKSPEQLAQRSRVKGVAALYRGISYQLLVYWKELAEGTTLNGYNMFMRHNIHHIGADGLVRNPRELTVTQGVLPEPAWVKAEFAPEGTMQVTWDAGIQTDKSNMDLLRIVVYAPHKKKTPFIWIADTADVNRQAGSFEWAVPQGIDGPLYFYGFFKARFTNDISSSFYLIGKV